MKVKQKVAVLILLGIFSLVAQVQAQTESMPADHTMIMPADIKWADAPPSFPPGAKMAVLSGNPKAAGSFTMRLKLPANYMIMPHSHPADEHVTVIEGSCYMGFGEKFDEKAAKEIPAGAFTVLATGTRHYVLTKKECILQVQGMGPWAATYTNSADDPRNKK